VAAEDEDAVPAAFFGLVVIQCAEREAEAGARFEPGNDLHRAMYEAFGRVFGDRLAEHPIELTRAVEQSGRFLSSVYEIDYRNMTRETWRRARTTFDRAYEEFRDTLLAAWANMENKS